MGNTCNSMADSCQCMSKTTQYCKVISLQLIKINEKNKCKRKCKVLQTEKVIYHMISLMGNLKRNDTNELMYKTERDSQTQRMNYGQIGRDNQGVWANTYTLLYLKWITNKDLLQSMGNSAPRYMAAWMGGGCGGRMDTCICLAHSLCCPPETIRTLLISNNPIQNKKLKKRKCKTLTVTQYNLRIFHDSTIMPSLNISWSNRYSSEFSLIFLIVWF